MNYELQIKILRFLAYVKKTANTHGLAVLEFRANELLDELMDEKK